MDTKFTLLRNKIEILEQQNLIMNILVSTKGFLGFYYSSLRDFETRKECFDYCNKYFQGLFGTPKYSSYEEFVNDNHLNIVEKPVIKTFESALELLEREYLISWFKSKGFNSWTSFKALVMHYYPNTIESVLYGFWQNKPVDAETQKNVGYVKQIIGD